MGGESRRLIKKVLEIMKRRRADMRQFYSPHQTAADANWESAGSFQSSRIEPYLREMPAAARGYRSIVVPLDGTRSAEHALPHALAIARRSGATLRLVHVHSLLNSAAPEEISYFEDLVSRLHMEKQEYLQSVACRLQRITEVRTQAICIEGKDIGGALRDAAAGASLIVMAARRQKLISQLLHRSVADALISQAACPILLLPGSDSLAYLASNPLPQHILVPLDYAKNRSTIVEAAASLSRLNAAEVTFANVRSLPELDVDYDAETSQRDLQEIARKLKRRGTRVNMQFVRSDESVTATLLSIAPSLGADLIALQTDARSAIQRLFKPSISKAVINRTRMPLLIVGPGAQKRSSRG